ncbi:hypothetical protein A1Q1_05713 [Trichosporon asahii var. asahii CBS 2479]|uniref:Uncharacterized protein n=1 Tax=Trichosporon asahii var. asahii (strain ATCC 90039 / CBS 2479 / JCM 2466 / KCTC 7840 / NBRC 103889/ NCYC 2677 / UAMH 7654) TaxID=1186058 RepID=J4U6K7_TRIAS|nr:hypothetical protein A1Q1_05713 [Trichosporon asahii var. asahii CBS 2479]EJT45800.1 hypothetical protein A1Q1_05713 [Trichosporon asahii var. asahii CBS 2479]
MLPAPVVIARSEVQSSVQLAPLAEFLAGLTENEHLNKLSDILDRFRTPKSYHRVDIRIVSSSDLPPSPGKEGADVDDYTLMKWSMERGDPIIVDDQPEAGPSGTNVPGDAEGREGMDVDIDPNGQPEIDRETQPSVADGEDLARRTQNEGREESPALSLPEQLFSDGSSPAKDNETPFHSAPHSPEKNAEMRAAEASQSLSGVATAEKEKEEEKGKEKEKEGDQGRKRLSAGMPIPLPPPAAALPMAVHFQFGLPPPVVPAPAEKTTVSAAVTTEPTAQSTEQPAQEATTAETLNETAGSAEPLPTTATVDGQGDKGAAALEPEGPAAETVPAAQAPVPEDVPPLAPDASANTTSAAQPADGDEELNQVLADKDAALVAIVDASRSPSPFTPSHPPPPGGSARFVRELRLDLRTLDSAALFELETWRREVLGLPPMDRIVPDSIWYQQVEPVPPTKKKGRKTNAEREAMRTEEAAKAAENGQAESEGEEEIEPEEEEDDIEVPSDKEEDYVPPAKAKKLGTGRPRGRPRKSETAPEAEQAPGGAVAAASTANGAQPKKRGRPSKSKPAESSSTPMEVEETEHVLDLLGPAALSPSPEPVPVPVKRVKPRRSIVEVVIPSPARSLASPATRSVPRSRKQSLKETAKETPTRARDRKSTAMDETLVSPAPRRSRRSNVAFDLEGSRPPSSSPPAPTRRTRASQAAASSASASPPPAPAAKSTRRTSRAAAELSSASPIRSPSPLPVLRTHGKAAASPTPPPARRTRHSVGVVEPSPAPATRRTRQSQVTVEPTPPPSRKRKAVETASPAPAARRTRHSVAEEAAATPPPSKRQTRSSGPAVLPEPEPSSTRKRRISVSSDHASPAPASKRTRAEPAKRHTAKRSGALPPKSKVTARRSGGAPPAKAATPTPPPAPRANRTSGALPARSSPVRARRSGGALPSKTDSSPAPRARRSGALPPKVASPPAPRAKRSGGALPSKKPVMAKRSGAPPKPAARATRARGDVSSSSPEPSPSARARSTRSETRNERLDYVDLPAPRVKLDMTLKRGRESYGRSVVLKVQADEEEGSDDEWQMFRNL